MVGPCPHAPGGRMRADREHTFDTRRSRPMRPHFPSVLVLLTFLTPARADYDPLRTNKDQPEHIDLTLSPASEAKPRDDTGPVPVRVYLPKSKSPAPVVLFSHGLGGNR